MASAREHLLEAAKSGDGEAVARLLDADPSLARRTPDGTSPVLLAAYHGHPEIARLFALRAAPLDLFEACAVGALDRVADLVAADPATIDSFAPDGFFPLALAAFFGHADVVRFLLDHGASVGLAARNAQRVTALHAAAARRDEDLVEMLLERGADPDARQEGGVTALHEAAASDDETIARMLVEHGARLDVRTDDGKTPEDLARELGRWRVAEWLALQAVGSDAQPSI